MTSANGAWNDWRSTYIELLFECSAHTIDDKTEDGNVWDLRIFCVVLQQERMFSSHISGKKLLRNLNVVEAYLGVT